MSTKQQGIIIAQRAVDKSLVRGERGERASLWLAGKSIRRISTFKVRRITAPHLLMVF